MIRSKKPDTARTGFSITVNRPFFTCAVTSQKRSMRRKRIKKIVLRFAINPGIFPRSF
jgi:hypothetical protein